MWANCQVMRLAILSGFLSLWMFSIIAPVVITLVSEGEDTVVILCHNEKEQKESGEKDKFEEKIIPESNFRLMLAYYAENGSPIDNITSYNSCHIKEIPLPPPEHLI